MTITKCSLKTSSALQHLGPAANSCILFPNMSVSLGKSMCDFHRGWYLPSNRTFANDVLHTLDLHFQGQTCACYEFAIKSAHAAYDPSRLSTIRRVCMSVWLSLCACLSACMNVFVCLSACLSVPFCLSVFLSVCMYVCISVCLCLSAWLSVCLYVCLSGYLSVCLSASAACQQVSN